MTGGLSVAIQGFTAAQNVVFFFIGSGECGLFLDKFYMRHAESSDLDETLLFQGQIVFLTEAFVAHDSLKDCWTCKNLTVFSVFTVSVYGGFFLLLF